MRSPFRSYKPEQQRSEVFPRTFRRSKSGDDEMVRVLGLDLQPVPRARLLVWALAMLRNNSFELVFRDGIEEILAARFDVIVVANPAAVVGNQLSKNGLAVLRGESFVRS